MFEQEYQGPGLTELPFLEPLFEIFGSIFKQNVNFGPIFAKNANFGPTLVKSLNFEHFYQWQMKTLLGYFIWDLSFKM